jgi:phosphonoacetaldehyde hydrolase
MVFRNMELLGVFPPAAVVTVDDTTVGVEAAVNAGTWAVGVVETGNCFGLTAAELGELNAAEREERFAAGKEVMLAAGAHYVIRSAAELLPTIDAISVRLGRGERP